MKQNLTRIQTDPMGLREKTREDLTLEQIRSSTVSNPGPFLQLLLPRDQVSSKTRYLTEDISTTETQVEMKRPAYELKIVADQNEKPLKIEIEVKSPGSNSVCLCDLSVSEDDLLMLRSPFVCEVCPDTLPPSSGSLFFQCRWLQFYNYQMIVSFRRGAHLSQDTRHI